MKSDLPIDPDLIGVENAINRVHSRRRDYDGYIRDSSMRPLSLAGDLVGMTKFEFSNRLYRIYKTKPT